MPVETKSRRNQKAMRLRCGKLIHNEPLKKLEDNEKTDEKSEIKEKEEKAKKDTSIEALQRDQAVACVKNGDGKADFSNFSVETPKKRGIRNILETTRNY